MKFSEIVEEVIAMARAANEVRVAKVAKDAPLIGSGSVATMDRWTPETAELRRFLEARPPGVVYMLLALVYLGRGDFPAREFRARVEDVRETFGDPKLVERELVSKWLLPEHLEEGLRKLTRARVDVDGLLNP
jgi:hypothetical protein